MRRELDIEFEQIWRSLDPIWKTGDKDDAKFFWLLGQKTRLDGQIDQVKQLRQEVSDARDRS